jgi:hypothetical protein
MDVLLYDVYLTGKLAAGLDREQAAARLAQIFKAAPATMLGLLTGKPQLLKRGVDKNTALKYREALQNAGVEVAFKAQTQNPAELMDKENSGSAARPAVTSISTATSNIASAQTTSAQTAIAQSAAVDTAVGAGLTLAPAGSNVLHADERRHVVAPTIDLSHLVVAAPGPLLHDSERASVSGAPIPSIDHLSLSATGSDLLTAAERTRIPTAVPDTGDYSLAPAGAPLDTLRPARVDVVVDISQLSLAPSGSDLLTPDECRKTAPPAPPTDHIKLS